MEAEVVTQSEQESPKGGSKEFDETESHGNLRLGPAEVEVAGDNLAAHIEILEEAVNEVAGTGEVEREAREELGLATHQNVKSGEEEESLNQAEANREEQVVEEPLEHGEQQQQPGGELVQQPCDEAGVSPAQHRLAGDEDQVEDRVVEQKTIGEVVKSREMAPPPDASHTLHEEDAETAVSEEMVRPSKSKSPVPQASSSEVNYGDDVERGLLVGNEDYEAGEEEEAEVGEQERNICLTEIPGKCLKQMIDLNPADCAEKIGEEAIEHNMMTEANKEMDNSGSKEGEKDDARDGLE